MAQTPKLLLPYPVATDPADGPAGFQNLATAVEASVVPGTVTSLPGTPYDGQVVNYLADATNGVVWRLRYRAAGGTVKWEFLGGAPLYGEVVAVGSTTSTTYVDFSPAGPTLTLPLAGDYLISHGALMYMIGSGQGYLSYAIGATAATDADAISTALSLSGLSVMRTRRKTITVAATVLAMKARVSAATFQAQDRWMSALPVRVG